MTVSPAELRKIPLFSNITDEHLQTLVAAFELRSLPAGEVLFEAGAVPERFLILVRGSVALKEGNEERFRLRPIAPVGELAAITGLERRMTAVTLEPSEVLSISTQKLMEFCEQHGDVAFPFHYNLLHVVADKVKRDQRRVAEMQHNIITTQKAMKRMRDALLEGEDTPLHKQLFDELEKLIEQNKKGRYLVEPARALPTNVRLDNGTTVPVTALSREWLKFAAGKSAPSVGKDWSGVLVLPGHELAVSGRVDHVEGDAVAVKLDMLIDEYAHALDDYLTRLQMLDVVL
ncbi:MAG: cyclic nucleotide-binding domain-containing protein [Myxococcales bacterium]|nr:cyclic nucleotide-binding domain-containing protein [Myxococcales bacterium]MCB9583165.1 cyclic nucleotide-binding domain-containing protein [Polyangiaceae bacterium]